MSIDKKMSVVLFLIIVMLSHCGKKDDIEQTTPKMTATADVKLALLDQIILQEQEGAYIGECFTFCVDERGWIYYGDLNSNQVVVFDPAGKQVRRIGKQGKAAGEIAELLGLAVGQGKVLVMEGGGMQIVVYDTLGNYRRSFKMGPTGDSYPWGNNVFVLSDHRIVISESILLKEVDWEKYLRETWLISTYDSSGNFLKHFGKVDDQVIEEKIFNTDLTGYPLLCVDEQDQIYASLTFMPKVHQYDRSGQLLSVIDVQSPLFIPATRFKDDIEQHIWDFSKIANIGFLPETEQLFVFHFHGNREDNTLVLYLNIYDRPTNSLICDVDVFELVAVKQIYDITVTVAGLVYFLTDVTPDHVTIQKYKLEINKKAE